MQLTNPDGTLSLGGIMDTIRRIEDSTSMSLPQFTKRSTILSRVYIENTLAGEEVLTPLMQNIMNIYVGFIMTAMNMNRYIDGSKTVRDALQVVATESFSQAPVDMTSRLDDYFLGHHATNMLSQRSLLELNNNSCRLIAGQESNLDTVNKDNLPKATGGSRVLDSEPKEATLPSGRVISVEFNVKDNGSFRVDMFLQLLPQFIPTDVAQQFIEMNFSPTLRQRWMQVSTGEINFFSDFLLGQDRRKRRFKAMRDDKSGALRDMVERQENNLSSAWLKLSQVTPDKQNIANTILIFDKSNFDRACSMAGLKFSNFDSRQKFFNKTFSMIVCVVDTMYNRIDMYYHGLNAMSTFTFEQMKKNAKNESVDMMTIMKTFANGMAPKF